MIGASDALDSARQLLATLKISSPNGVWKPTAYAVRFIAAILRHEAYFTRARALDLGCGSGVLALAMARLGAQVTAIDVIESAIVATQANARRNGLSIQAQLSDGLTALQAESQHSAFDALVCNHYHIPGEVQGTPNGDDGRRLLDIALIDGAALLRPGGLLLTSCTAGQGFQRTDELLQRYWRTYSFTVMREPMSAHDYPESYRADCVAKGAAHDVNGEIHHLVRFIEAWR
jgi:methylase of polypeptide subunit release factors